VRVHPETLLGFRVHVRDFDEGAVFENEAAALLNGALEIEVN